ncbi:MarR family winged helix-turn-helix transcriptional regulator [Spartinivicinus ruber]|uniref:MarR family winged helix-turn-helix transcriptional regulator n=1 Tax=Spartinivicinus ruber TaxID=2683272 RepID=UPI0013D13DB6|nr:MarR family transcriptional regulator [Spartinivicinus ruber]
MMTMTALLFCSSLPLLLALQTEIKIKEVPMMITKKLAKLSKEHPRITIRTLATLMAINDNEGCSVSELSQFMGVNEKNVATTIRRLEEGRDSGDVKLIKVKQNKDDKRFKLVWLTAKGKALLKRLG